MQIIIFIYICVCIAYMGIFSPSVCALWLCVFLCVFLCVCVESKSPASQVWPAYPSVYTSSAVCFF